tara:strand:- start:7 stop:393 length:387 start_codon:yes stop_codon:yes gene_type:complete
MPANVTYVSEEDAQAYAKEIGGVVIPIDEDGDGVPEGWRVAAEGPTRGINPDALDDKTDQDALRDYLRESWRAGIPPRDRPPRGDRNMGGVVVDELGYRRGGMKFKERGSVKYSAGGAVRGKNFAGTF